MREYPGIHKISRDEKGLIMVVFKSGNSYSIQLSNRYPFQGPIITRAPEMAVFDFSKPPLIKDYGTAFGMKCIYALEAQDLSKKDSMEQ